MPLYEYRCLRCGRRSEVLQKMNEAPLTVCPDCGGQLQKQVSAPSFQFKGSGWYATDYGKGSGSTGEAAKSESTESKAGGTDAPAGSTAPATETKAKPDGGATAPAAPAAKSD